MQLGFRSFTFRQYMRDGRIPLLDVMDWIRESNATHMEIAAMSLTGQTSDESTLESDPELIRAIKASKTACRRPQPALATRSDCSRRFEP